MYFACPVRGVRIHNLLLLEKEYSGFGVNIMPADSQSPGPRLNIKTVLSTYGDFHVKDKTAVRTSYL